MMRPLSIYKRDKSDEYLRLDHSHIRELDTTGQWFAWKKSVLSDNRIQVFEKKTVLFISFFYHPSISVVRYARIGFQYDANPR